MLEPPESLVQMMRYQRNKALLAFLGGAAFLGLVSTIAASQAGFGTFFTVAASLCGLCLAFAAGSTVLWGPNGKTVRFVMTTLPHLRWAYARRETTVVVQVTSQHSRVEHGVRLHFASGVQFDLPDDGTHADAFLTWLRGAAPQADIGFSSELQRKHGAARG
jgi:hypothetical protein